MDEKRKDFRNKNEINIIPENIRMKESDLNKFHSLFDDKVVERTKSIFHNKIFKNIYEKEKEIEDDNNKEDIEEENFILEEILSDLNKENQTEENKACEEILDILKKPFIEKSIYIECSPFKPLLKPKNISMKGKILVKAL